MSLHPETFMYYVPTDEQKEAMEDVRNAAAEYAEVLEAKLPEGPDKTYTLRTLRTVAMWANISITRQPDGSPRK